jgi:hypothetical protein
MAKLTIESHQNDSDLLTEIEASQQELPMSLAWFRRTRLRGGGPPFLRVSNRVFYRRSELRGWILDRANRTIQPDLAPGCPLVGGVD